MAKASRREIPLILILSTARPTLQDDGWNTYVYPVDDDRFGL
jgi:hypothetical protein